MTLKVQGIWEAERLAGVVGLYATAPCSEHWKWAADLEKRLRLQIRKHKDESNRKESDVVGGRPRPRKDNCGEAPASQGAVK